MGKKSIRENKNIYQLTRESLDLTREKASELLDTISADRIEKIESGKSIAHPDEVMTMSNCYKNPNLCNHFCSQECPIGIHYVPRIEPKILSQIVLEMLASLDSINNKKSRLIEITADGKISDDELSDFLEIQQELEQISVTVESLQLWVESMIMNGDISRQTLEQIKKTQGID